MSLNYSHSSVPNLRENIARISKQLNSDGGVVKLILELSEQSKRYIPMMKVYSKVAVVVSACLCVVLGEISVRFRARFNAKLKEHQVHKIVTTDGLMMCLVLCKSEESFVCEAASWGEGTCLLSQYVMIHELTDDLNRNENWTTMCRIVYPVFHAHGDSGAFSLLTFDEGNTRCERSGSKMASREDLLQSRAMGFEMCVCGLLADGTVGFVMLAPSSCWYQWSEGIIEGCTDGGVKFDVYCKV